MTTTPADRVEELRARAEAVNNWLWDNWRLTGSETYERVEREWRVLTAELAAARRELEHAGE